MNEKQLHEVLLQSLEHEAGGVEVYAMAIRCAVRDDLKTEWTKYFEQTKRHVERLDAVCRAFGLDPATETPGRAVVRHNGAALVAAMKMALDAGDLVAAQIVACECVVLAETKDHADWTLLEKCADVLEGEAADTLRAACEEVEDEEDEHLYHSRGWCRELWVESLGLHAVLPPPEEVQNVKTAMAAARAEQLAENER